MIELFFALLTAHLISDFLLQTDWIVARKRENKSRLLGLMVHIIITVAVLAVFILPATNTSSAWTEFAAILGVTAIAHFLTDLLKELWLARLGTDSHKGRAAAFIVDQLAHLMVIIALAVIYTGHASPALVRWIGIGENLVPDTHYFAALSVISTYILGVFVGGHLIGLLTDTLSPGAGGRAARDDEGLKGGGKIIGWLERALVIGFVYAGQLGAIGFVIAAKSILRFGDVGPKTDSESADRDKVEYIIIGTFMSFGWALLVAGLGLAAKDHFIGP